MTTQKIMTSRRGFMSRIMAGATVGSVVAAAARNAVAASERRDARCQAVLDRLRGPMASITIPYNKDYSIDYGSLRAWVDFVCERKAPILFLTYGDSELGFLSEAEIEKVIRTVASQTKGRSLVIGGTGAWWTGRTIDFINRVEDSGVDAINIHIGELARREEEIYGAFRDIDAATNVPLLTVDRKYSVDLMKRLARIPKVIGDKCHEELYGYYDIIRETRPYNFAVVSAGQMKHHLFGYLIGSPAYLCPIAPFAPQVSNEFQKKLETGDVAGARDMVNRYEEGLLKITGPLGYPHCYKSLNYLTGVFKTTLVRPPRRSNQPEELSELKAFLEKEKMLPA